MTPMVTRRSLYPAVADAFRFANSAFAVAPDGAVALIAAAEVTVDVYRAMMPLRI
jgi:hypothetical protein